MVGMKNKMGEILYIIIYKVWYSIGIFLICKPHEKEYETFSCDRIMHMEGK